MAGNSPFVKAFNCPSCGAAQTLRAFGQSQVFLCSSCGSTIDVSKEPFSVLRAMQELKVKPDIPIAARGKFGEDLWEVIGFMVRSDRSGQYSWDEYLLFNPFKGFRWLMQMDGHWNFIETLTKPPRVSSNTLSYEGKDFDLFLEDSARVDFVLGEFYWRVKVGDTTKVKDFISPPYVLSEEVDASERIYSIGDYLYPKEIEKAFKISLSSIPRSGVFPNQPAPFDDSAGLIYVGGLFFIFLIFATQFAFISNSRRNVLFSSTYTVNSSDQIKSRVSDPFVIPYKDNVELKVNAVVDNAWVEVGFELVDTATQAALADGVEVSFYHGIDSDGAWSEGGHSYSKIIGAVPAGTYQLEVEPSLDPKITSQEYSVTAIHDISYYGNFGLAFFLTLIPASIVLITRYFFNKRRWENSNLY